MPIVGTMDDALRFDNWPDALAVACEVSMAGRVVELADGKFIVHIPDIGYFTGWWQ